MEWIVKEKLDDDDCSFYFFFFFFSNLNCFDKKGKIRRKHLETSFCNQFKVQGMRQQKHAVV